MQPTVEKLSSQDLDSFAALIGLFESVFEMENFRLPSPAHLQTLLNRDDFFVFVARHGAEVVGGLTAYVLRQYYSEKPLVYVYDLAVRPDYQRRGIGRSLMASVTEFCRSSGMEEVFVQADVVDDHAVAFYQSTGGIAEEVIHFYYPLAGK